jgi:hypothetical protein
MRKVKTSKAALIILAAVVVGFAFLTIGWPTMERTMERRQAEAESFHVLSKAHTQQELQEAVGDLGLLLSLRGGVWIAIRYVDKHAGMRIWSSSVARDSGGAWFVSDFHFCGKFAAYRHAKERMVDLEQFSDIQAVEEAENLEVARKLLVGLGFRPVPPPTSDSL